jgi:hypothetical protein
MATFVNLTAKLLITGTQSLLTQPNTSYNCQIHADLYMNGLGKELQETCNMEDLQGRELNWNKGDI